MKKLGDMKLYSFDEIQDEIIGPIGTPERDAFEQELARELQARLTPKENTSNHTINLSTPTTSKH